MPDAVAALREAVEVVRAQIPRGELTVASVQRLLEAAETVCTGGAGPSPAAARAAARQASRRQEERRKWARIAQENEREARAAPIAAE